MGKFHDSIKQAHKDFIQQQHIFFVSTAPLSGDGRVNLSPKGLDCFQVLSDTKVGYMDLISSGNETSAHTLENGRITFMFTSFEGAPNILRLYGKGFTVLPSTPSWEEYAPHFTIYAISKKLFIADIDFIQIACAFGVPRFNYVAERPIHSEQTKKKGKDGLYDYVQQNNLKSLDGLATDLGVQQNAE